MNCQDVRPLLLDRQRGGLTPDLAGAVGAHLEGCATCAHEDAAEQLLTEALEHRLPQHAAPIALKRRLAAEWAAEPLRAPSWWNRWGRSLGPALGVAAVLLLAIPLFHETGNRSGRLGSTSMVAEAVNDHLRIVSSQHPLDIESGGMHQVKPWFEGRLDFAPAVHFLGDEEFPLKGGAIGYYFDRKAAVLVFNRRLHEISLLIFRAEGLPWPTSGLQSIGATRASLTTSRGFNVILWRAGELGYALVSDVDASELTGLATKLAGGA